MLRQFATTCIQSGIAVLLLLALIVSPAWAQPSTTSGTVEATSTLYIRSCANLHCDVVARATLGDSLEITGDLDNGFYPVRWQGTSGYAYALYLNTGNGAPWFVEGTPACNQVSLIFDIGIGYEPSTDILDTLISTDTPATMFPMGWWALAFPAYLRQLDAAGFPIGTHGDQPIFLTELSTEAVRADIENSTANIENVLGRDIDEYFTPYAADSNDQVRGVASSLGFLPVGWNIAANDYGPDATEFDVYHRIMGNVYPGAIIEMHLDGPATSTSTALALPRIIADLEAMGYEFVSIPDLVIPCDGVTPS
jgi:peptidoglycan/xylan/chitin deacetylase (PgdA/CDA1 family)